MPELNSREHYYEIVVEGLLDSRRVRRFEGLTMTTLPNSNTRLAGIIPDQAALHAYLTRIRDMGLNLLLVRQYSNDELKGKEDE